MLLQMLFWDAVWGAVGGASDGAGARLMAGCCLGRSSGGAVGGAGVQSLLSGAYAGVIFFFFKCTLFWAGFVPFQLKCKTWIDSSDENHCCSSILL